MRRTLAGDQATLNECAASISIHPDSCTDRSRSGTEDEVTAPPAKVALALSAVGTSAVRLQLKPNSGSPSTVCRKSHADCADVSTILRAASRAAASSGALPGSEDATRAR